MCPSLINDFVEVLLTTVAAYLEGDGSPVRKLFLQRLSDVEHLKVFHLLAAAFNITPDEVHDSRIFYKCNSLELLKLLAEKYEIPKAAAVSAFHRACKKGSKDTAIWLTEHFQLTKDDLFSESCGLCGWDIMHSGNLDFIKWVVAKYQITMDELWIEFDDLCLKSDDVEVVRWFVSTYTVERYDALEAFYTACISGYEKIAKFLAEFYQLTPTEIRSENWTLKKCDDPVLRKWLIDNYYIDPPIAN